MWNPILYLPPLGEGGLGLEFKPKPFANKNIYSVKESVGRRDYLKNVSNGFRVSRPKP